MITMGSIELSLAVTVTLTPSKAGLILPSMNTPLRPVSSATVPGHASG